MHQTSFTFKTEDSYNFDEFIISKSNLFAHDVITKWPASWGVNPYPKTLILKGPPSSGKTFLAKKWANISGAIFLNKDDLLSLDLLSNYPTFIIENFDEYWHEETVFHYFNAINECGKYLLITTNQIPNIGLPDLKSRITSLNHINIEKPDDQMIEALIFKLFSHYSIVVNPEIISFLLKILSRNCYEVIKSVQDINEYALVNKHKITIPLIKKALNII